MTAPRAGDGLRVLGDATHEEIAAVIAAVVARVGRDEPEASGYVRWRAARRHALRRVVEAVDRPT